MKMGTPWAIGRNLAPNKNLEKHNLLQELIY